MEGKKVSDTDKRTQKQANSKIPEEGCLFRLLMQLGIGITLFGLISYLLPVFGLKFKAAGYLERPGAKLYTVLTGLGLLLLAYLMELGIWKLNKRNE
jgi:hypothetical protein